MYLPGEPKYLPEKKKVLKTNGDTPIGTKPSLKLSLAVIAKI